MAEQEKAKQSQQRKQPETLKGNGGAQMTHRPGAMAPYSFRPFDRLRDEFNRVFDRFFDGGLPALSGDGSSDWRWGLDLDETEDTVVVRAEAPGFEPKDFDIHV